jgi:hypothetical protein
MVITYRNLHLIKFPAYKLPSTNWHVQDGLVYLDALILDDKNTPGDTLGQRRLHTPFKSIHPLKHSVNSALGIVKEPSGQAYIDNSGKIFIYSKTRSSKLKSYKIRQIDRKITYSLVWCNKIHFPFAVPRPPTPNLRWANILHVGEEPWILYSYSQDRIKDTRRKI